MAKIAVLNDDPDFIDLMKQVLSDSGHESYAGHAGRLAVESMKQEQPDLVVLDILLDGGDTGFNVLTMMRLTQETRHIPVIICTAKSPFEIDPLLAQSRQEKVSVVYKPFDLDQLLDEIDSLLNDGAVPAAITG